MLASSMTARRCDWLRNSFVAWGDQSKWALEDGSLNNMVVVSIWDSSHTQNVHFTAKNR